MFSSSSFSSLLCAHWAIKKIQPEEDYIFLSLSNAANDAQEKEENLFSHEEVTTRSF